MEKRKKKCIVNSRKYKSIGGECAMCIGEQFEGIFHKWGNKIKKDKKGNLINGTIGIIEDENGKIHTVNPKYITFINK